MQLSKWLRYTFYVRSCISTLADGKPRSYNIHTNVELSTFVHISDVELMHGVFIGLIPPMKLSSLQDSP